MALGLLKECYSASPQDAQLVLIKLIPGFQYTSTLTIAMAVDNREFMTHETCLEFLENIWERENFLER